MFETHLAHVYGKADVNAMFSAIEQILSPYLVYIYIYISRG